MRNMLSFLLNHIADITEPLYEMLGSDEAITYYSQCAGFDFSFLHSVGGNVVAEFVEAYERFRLEIEDESPSFSDFEALLISARELIRSVRILGEELSSSGAGIGDLGRRLPDFLLAHYVNRLYPATDSLLRCIGLIAYSDGLATQSFIGKTYTIKLDVLTSALRNPSSHFRELYFADGFATTGQANAIARQLFPIVGDLIGSIGGRAYFDLYEAYLGSDSAGQLSTVLENSTHGMLWLELYSDDNGDGDGILLSLAPDELDALGLLLTVDLSPSFSVSAGRWNITFALGSV